ncbi:MAG: hypothetical protein Q9183_003926 [Haloplaca sp. 2 TL-2023]
MMDRILALRLLSISLPLSTASLQRRSIRPAIEISDGEIDLPPKTSGYTSACSTLTTTIGTRVDTIPVPCYNALSTPTLTQNVMIGTTRAVLIIGPSGDIEVQSKPWLLGPPEPTDAPFAATSSNLLHESAGPASRHATASAGDVTTNPDPFPTPAADRCPATSVDGIPGCWGQPACAYYL